MNGFGARRTIGEFVLIVVGVLAALAAESWVSGRAERGLAEAYRLELQDDLRADSLQIAFWRAMTDTRRLHLQRLLDDLNGMGRVEAGSESILALYHASIIPAPSFPQTTLEDLTSTGNLQLLDRELRRAAFQYRQSHVQLEGDRAAWSLGKPSFTSLIPGAYQAAAMNCYAATPAADAADLDCFRELAELNSAEMPQPEVAALESWRQLPGVREELQSAIAYSGTFIFFLNLVEAARADAVELLR